MEKGELHVRRTLRLHELHGQPEQSPSLVRDHLEVVGFAGAGQGVAPEEIHSLASVQVQQFLSVYVYCLRGSEFRELFEGEEVDVVGRVDRLGCAENGVCDWDAAAEEGGVFHVVDPSTTVHRQC